MPTPRQAMFSNFGSLNLVVKIVLPSTFEERIPASFRLCRLKVRAENQSILTPYDVGHCVGEWLDKDRLEQRWEP